MQNLKKIKYTSVKIYNSKKNKTFTKVVKDNFLDLTKIKKKHVVIKVEYSNLNYKDFLMAKSHSGLVKNYPHTPGIDASGIIFFSNSRKFKQNQKVYILAKPLGVEINGAFSEYIIVPDQWVSRIPKYTNAREIISLGTSGFTAFAALEKSYKIIYRNKNKSVLVSGATGNVGMILIHLLKKMNTKIEVITSNFENISPLKKMGIKKIYQLEKFYKAPNFAMLTEKYSVIYDNLGGDIISVFLRLLIKKGILVSIGNVLGNIAKINILPLILRGISILGLNTESLSKKERTKIIEKLKLRENKLILKKRIRTISLMEVSKILNRKKLDKKFKRFLIKI